jgi:toxin ParE1/3/4
LTVPRVRHTARARRDLIEIWLDVAAANSTAADDIYARLATRVKILEAFPEAGPPRWKIAADARALTEPPYVILYRILADGVQIVRVLHGARHIDTALFMEGIE